MDMKWIVGAVIALLALAVFYVVGMQFAYSHCPGAEDRYQRMYCTSLKPFWE